MKISQVDIVLGSSQYNSSLRTEYQFYHVYLSLFVSDFIKAKKLDLGNFNRLIFQEGEGQEDLKVAGDKAFCIHIKPEYSKEVSESPKKIHEYFVKKYLEGFRRVDGYFNVQLAKEIEIQIKEKYISNELNYIKKIQTKSLKLNQIKFDFFHEFNCYHYKLIVKLSHKNKYIDEMVLLQGYPDPFLVNSEIKSIEMDGSTIKVLDALKMEYAIFKIKKTTNIGQKEYEIEFKGLPDRFVASSKTLKFEAHFLPI
jgi:hypothetical protein